jgi:hypothetical protein
MAGPAMMLRIFRFARAGPYWPLLAFCGSDGGSSGSLVGLLAPPLAALDSLEQAKKAGEGLPGLPGLPLAFSARSTDPQLACFPVSVLLALHSLEKPPPGLRHRCRPVRNPQVQLATALLSDDAVPLEDEMASR